MKHLVKFPKMGIEISVNEDVFKIGTFEVKWYGLLIGLGIVLAMIYAVKQAKKMDINIDDMLDVIIFGMIGGIVGARLYYVIFFPGDQYWQNPMKIFAIRDGGLGFYGGLIGGLLAALMVAKIRKINIPALFDLIALGFLIGSAIGRWGNFTNQEAFGGPTNLPWGMQSNNTLLSVDGPVHPCFLYESLLCAIGFVALHFFNKNMRKYDGQTFLLYLAWYGFIRFIIESTRTDSLRIGGENGLKVSMVVSALFVVVAIVALIVLRNRTKLSGVGNRRVQEALKNTDSDT